MPGWEKEDRGSPEFSDAAGIVTKSGLRSKPARWDHSAQTLYLGDGRVIPYAQCRIRLVRTKYKEPEIPSPRDGDPRVTPPVRIGGWSKRQKFDDPVRQYEGVTRGAKPRAMLSIDDGKWLLFYEGKQAEGLIESLAAASIRVEDPL